LERCLGIGVLESPGKNLWEKGELNRIISVRGKNNRRWHPFKEKYAKKRN